MLLAFVFVQAVGGVLHHLQYNKIHRRTAITHTHIWFGRGIITLGMINGGFGLQLTEESTRSYIAYGVVVGLVWLIWMAIDVWATFKGSNPQRLAEKDNTLPRTSNR